MFQIMLTYTFPQTVMALSGAGKVPPELTWVARSRIPVMPACMHVQMHMYVPEHTHAHTVWQVHAPTVIARCS